MFVELDLNAAKYVQKQQDILESGKITANKLEEQYKNLGIKSADHFDLLRQKAENSYALIKNAGTSSAGDITRAHTAMTEKITSLNEQQFGKSITSIGFWKDHWISATVAIGAAMVVISKAGEYMEIGAKAQQAAESFDLVGKSAGYSADRLDNFKERMSAAAAGTVDDSDIMQKAVKGMVLGLSDDQMVGIMEAARISARVAGEDVKTAYEKITDAISTGMPKALRQYGLVSKEEAVIVNAALKAGVEGIDLYRIAMTNASIQAAKFGEVHDTAAEKIQRHRAILNEAKETVAQWALAVAASTIQYLTHTEKQLLIMDGMRKQKEQGAAADMEDAENGIAMQERSKALYLTGIKEKTEAAKGAEAERKRIEAEEKKAAELLKKMQNDSTAAYIKGVDEEIEVNEKALREEAAEQKKYWNDVDKLREDSLKDYLLGLEKETEEVGKAMNEQYFAEKKATADRLTAERDLYKDLRGYDDQYYEASQALIASQAAEYRKKGIDEIAVAAWVAQETEKQAIRKAKAEGDFMAGVNAGFIEMQNNAMTFGKAGYEVFNTLATTSQKTMSDVLFDGIKTGTIDTEKIWTTFSDNMLRKFTDIVGQMVVDAAAKDIALAFQANWTADSSAVLGLLNKVWDLGSSLVGGSGAGSVGSDVGDWAAGAGGYGSHATGLNYVPADNYLANLHEGEAILTKEQADMWRRTSGDAAFTKSNLAAASAFIRSGAFAMESAGAYQEWQTSPYGPMAEGRGDQSFVNPVNPLIFSAQFEGENDYVIRYRDGSVQHLDISDSNNTFSSRYGAGIVQTVGQAIMSYVNPLVGAANAYLYSASQGGETWENTLKAVVSYYAGESAGGGASGTDTGLASYVGKAGLGYAIKAGMGSLFGGGASGSGGGIGFAGMDDGGLFASLSGSMGAIAPQSSRFSFPMFGAKNGLDYVPYDNFPILAHKGERVQTAGEVAGLVDEIRALLPYLRVMAKTGVKLARIADSFDQDRMTTGILTRTA
jgi:hypothetical protein